MQTLTYHYSQWLVLVSFVISVLGAYTALFAMSSIATGMSAQTTWRYAAFAGLALGGVGIWSMHFLGMLALELPVGVGYRAFEAIVSLIVAVTVSILALGFLASRPFSIGRLLLAGPIAGIAVALMHYIGMSGMRFGGSFQWNLTVVATSVAIAVVAATAALWLAFHTRTTRHRTVAALVMGAAVCSMHYTGMAGAAFVCSAGNSGPNMTDLLRPDLMLVLVTLISFLVLGLISLKVLTRQLSALNIATA
jgi:NO-binding membrane sensor protein with MHYT domain